MTAEELKDKLDQLCINYKQIILKDVKSTDKRIELLANFNWTIEQILRTIAVS